jgi:hypothetical protein
MDIHSKETNHTSHDKAGRTSHEETAYLTKETAYLAKDTAYLTKETAYLTKETAYLTKETTYLTKETAYRLVFIATRVKIGTRQTCCVVLLNRQVCNCKRMAT